MGNYYEEKSFKIHTKRKKVSYGEILDVIIKINKHVKRKNPTKAQTRTVESKKAKTTIRHPSERKKLEKIPGKNDNYYIEHREGTNPFRIRKDPKQAKEDELKTMLETVEKGIKRATSKSKLSGLKRIEKQVIKQYEDLGEELLTVNELQKLFKSLQTDAKTVSFTKENINNKLLKKN